MRAGFFFFFNLCERRFMSLSSSACPAVLSELPDPPGTSVPSEPFGADAGLPAVPNVGRPVGVLDSGVGGLTLRQAQLPRMPHQFVKFFP